MLLRDAFGEQGMIDEESVLTVPLCRGERAGKLAVNPDFGAR
jgi:hypothetical protein